MKRLLAAIVLVAVTACSAEEACNDKGAVELLKTYGQTIGDIQAGTTFRQASLDNFAVCQEIAEMYNAKPSVQQAPAQLRFFCSKRGEQ
jgi:hypothetical protein